MKVILEDNNQFVIRFDKGEEVFASLTEFLQANNIKACTFSAIGAVGEVDLGYFNTHLKDYRKKPYVDDFEVIAFSGNGGVKDNVIVLHAHGLFGRNDFTSIGGHVFRMVVSVTCELYLTKLNGELKRENNPDFNLNLLA